MFPEKADSASAVVQTLFTDHAPVLTSHAKTHEFTVEKVQRRATEMTEGMQRGDESSPAQ